MSEFGELLRGLRTARSLTQDELAGRARLTVNAVGALERGERLRPYPSTVRALADALDLDQEGRHALVAAVPSGTPPSAAAGHPGAPDLVGLPHPGVPMIGRDDDLAAVIAMLRSPGRRIVSLTGPGGIGKTTLALAAAEVVREDVTAVVHVELADVADPGRILPAVAAAAGVPESSGGTARQLASALTGRRLLLLLDNVERVLDGADQIAGLVAACPDLAVLTTGRASLRVRAEQEFRVGPLARGAAVALFRDRLAAAGGDAPADGSHDDAVDVLCARADGLPLALELAATLAARVGPTALLERFDARTLPAPRDLPSRQRSIAATFAWSYELLDEPARVLLRRMSVFVGGFTLVAAQLATTHAPSTTDPVVEEGVEVLAALEQLIDHALVLRVATASGEVRFRILEPLREEAVARLSDEDLLGARGALARVALAINRELSVRVRGPEQTRALDLFESGMGNVGVALAHFLDHDLVDDAVELLWSVRLLLGLRGHTRYGTDWVRRLQPHPMTGRSRARLSTAWAVLLAYGREPARGAAVAEEALTLADRAGDRASARDAAVAGAVGAALTGDLPAVRRFVERVEQDDEAVAEDGWIALRLHAVRGLVCLLRDDLDEAARHLEAGEDAARDHGGDYDVALFLLNRSVVDHRRGDRRALVARMGEAVGFSVRAASPALHKLLMPGLARVALDLGDLDAGVRLFGAASVYDAEYELPQPVGDHAALLVPLARAELSGAREGLGEAAFATAWSAGRSSTVADVATLAATFTPGAEDLTSCIPTPSRTG